MTGLARHRTELDRVFRILMFLLDMAAVYGAFMLAYAFRFRGLDYPRMPDGTLELIVYQQSLIVVVGVWALLFIQQRFYHGERAVTVFDDAFRIVKAVTYGTALILAATFFGRRFSYSRLVVAYGYGLGILLVFASHQMIRLLRGVVFRRMLPPLNTVVIGEGRIAEAVRHTLGARRRPWWPYQGALSPQALEPFLDRHAIRELIVAEFPRGREEFLAMADLCEQKEISVRFIPDVLELRLGALTVDDFFGLPVLKLRPVPGDKLWWLVKRVMDVVFSAMLLLLLGLPMLLIALLVRLNSPGPALYRQTRVGKGGRHFDFLKFRSMRIGADHELEKIKHLSERPGPVFKMRQDPRVTRVGRWLRRFSLDELPQILNVLRGDMSLVGPRPPVPWEVEKYDAWAKKRLRVLPGITGLWQVSGRSDLTFDEMLRLDMYYIENWSLELDLKILLRTIPAVLHGRGAY